MENPPPLQVDGRAGRGKTYVLYPVIGALRKVGEIILLSASSAFAAKNYPGGRTTHYLYGVPVDEYKSFLMSSVGPKVCGQMPCHRCNRWSAFQSFRLRRPSHATINGELQSCLGWTNADYSGRLPSGAIQIMSGYNY
jgi:hypothetical protein